VREEDLSTIFEECGARLRRPELEALADRFASGSTGWVQYSALLAAVDARVREATGRRATPHAGRPTGVPEDVVGKVRALIETLMIRGKDYRAEMDVFDSSFTGCIPQGDFRDVMQVCPSPSVRLHPLPPLSLTWSPSSYTPACLSLTHAYHPVPQDRFRGNLSSKDLEVLEKAYRDVEDPRRVNHVRLFHDAHPKHYGRQAFDSAEAEQVWHLAEELRQKIRCVGVCVCLPVSGLLVVWHTHVGCRPHCD
jgi:hypothetical protein